MLSKNYFYYEMIKKYIIAFSYVLSDIHIQRTNEINDIITDFIVPYEYLGKSKEFYRMQKSESGGKISKVFPHISYIINRITYDTTRKSNILKENIIDTVDGTATFLKRGKPYDFNCDVTVKTKYLSDMYQIIEQLITFFNPDFVLTVNEIPELDIKNNIVIVLNDVNLPDNFDMDETNDRELISTLNFTLKGFLYPPITTSNIIKEIELNLSCDESKLINNKWVEIIGDSEEIIITE